MKSAIGRIGLVVTVLSVLAASPSPAQEMMTPGLWQFTSEDQAGMSSSGGTSFTSCIDPARSVPVDPRIACKVDGVNRQGATVNWTMTCSVPQGTFRSQAVAQYRGRTMTGTMTTYVPMIAGQMTQRISGRFLGPCTR